MNMYIIEMYTVDKEEEGVAVADTSIAVIAKYCQDRLLQELTIKEIALRQREQQLHEYSHRLHVLQEENERLRQQSSPVKQV